jgi:DNA repair protein RadC
VECFGPFLRVECFRYLATPSEADIKVTRDLIRAGQLLKVELLDHVIMGTATADRPGHKSLRELGFFCS